MYVYFQVRVKGFTLKNIGPNYVVLYKLLWDNYVHVSELELDTRNDNFPRKHQVSLLWKYWNRKYQIHIDHWVDLGSNFLAPKSVANACLL